MAVIHAKNGAPEKEKATGKNRWLFRHILLME
jgi:hypothetical protein